MEESLTTRPLVGRWIALDVRPMRPLTFLGPSWAVLVGAMASGGLSFRGQALLSLVLAILLCDALLGAWRALWLQSDWRDALRRSSASAATWLVPSNDRPVSRFLNVFRRFKRRVIHFRQVIWPVIDSEITGLVVIGALALSIAVILGQVPLVLTSLVMLFALIEGRIGTARGAGLRAVGEITFPWLIAESAFGHFSWLSLVYALLFTLVYRALLGLVTTRQSQWIAWSNLAQVAAVLLLMATNTPAGVGIVLLGLLAQVLWQARYNSDRDGQAYARRVQSYMLVAMLVAGLSLWL
ncbi:MAG: hypothetical protein HY782_28820 [Chloroflexi bacterium]|nr:hypothetical protein [Chloroflexota bacterium]